MSTKLAWGGWLYGLIGGFIGGGAAAVSAGVAQSVTDPAHADVPHLFYLMGVTFLISGAISTALYLKQSPLPSPVDVQVKETTTTQDSSGGTKVTELKMTGTIPPPDKP